MAGTFKGNVFHATKVFYTDKGDKNSGQHDGIEFLGPDGTGLATNPMDLDKAKAYTSKQKSQLFTDEVGISREDAIARLPY